ncbi:MAG: response regulator [Alphaproteobacteria bacterium]|nr:response regulator [Alphaproteobacteria bacterium]
MHSIRDENQQIHPPTPTAAGYKPNKVYILHVEDDEVDAILIRKAILRYVAREMPQHEFVMDYVVSLTGAMEKLLENDYHLILLDLALTDVGGLDNVQALKAQAPSSPIVVLTGTCDSDLAVKAIETGADDYIMKMEMGEPTFVNAIKRALQLKPKLRIERA